ncbi:hypothetical protein HMF8227_02037 [Saliniradius amylolyticus]|uniref:Uncharacterized protein n=1 Tax=Saliniradius amylolyticus TaxID=2183582 RepID=A0A2S2E4Q9_9ALTE|nr:hypothetical protein [Saliniradius amylolyticus]AWL12502.1 hypothetical protein HMF8227_02037 [Saliniradius amylolyticus]
MSVINTPAALVIGSTLAFSAGAQANTISLSELASHFLSTALSATASEVQSSVRTNVLEAARFTLSESSSMQEEPESETQPEESKDASQH